VEFQFEGIFSLFPTISGAGSPENSIHLTISQEIRRFSIFAPPTTACATPQFQFCTKSLVEKIRNGLKPPGDR
jgi:hypothetical protein